MRSLSRILKAGKVRLEGEKTREIHYFTLETSWEQDALAQERYREAEKGILEAAQREAEAIKEAARAAGREEGFQEGREQGLNQAAAETEALLREARQLLHRAREERDQILAAAEAEIVSIVLDATAAVLGERAAENGEVTLELTKKLIATLTKAPEYQVFANPQTAEQLRRYLADHQDLLPAGTTLAIVPWSALAAGDLRVETNEQVAEYTLAHFLEQLARELKRGLPDE